MKTKVNWTSFLAAVRTAGALMAGNVFVALFVLKNKDYVSLWLLLLLGIAAIIVASLETKEK
jgi:hypothetical protein